MGVCVLVCVCCEQRAVTPASENETPYLLFYIKTDVQRLDASAALKVDMCERVREGARERER